jgi:hypothetical protein
MHDQFDHELRVNYNIDRMQHAPIRDRQLRMATANQPDRLAGLPARIRLSIGAMLIAAGQRIRHEPALHADVITRPVP